MSTTRLDPRERVEQSQLAAALAASRQVEATPQQQPLPPPSATKYGDLGSGTLLTTTTETTATSTSGSAQGKVSEDRLGLLSSLGGGDDSISRSNERRHIDQQTTPRMLSSNSTRPSARAPKRTLIDEDGDLSLPPAAALNAAAHELGSAHKTNIPAANDTIMADDTAEVIGDSDEESRPSSYILSDLSQLPAAKPVERASTATSSIVDPTASSAVPGPSKPSKASRTSDPIAMTTTATSSSSRTGSASKQKNMLQDGFDLKIVVAPNPRRRTSTAASKSGASGKSKARNSITSTTSKASKKRDAESSDDTDYDTLPGEKAAKKTATSTRRKETNTTERVRGSSRDLDHDDNAALPRKKNRTRTSTIMRDSPPPRLVKNGAEEMPVSDASEDPLLIRANEKSESAEHPHGGAPRPPKGRRPIAVEDSEEEGISAGGDDAGSAVATGGGDADSSAPKRNGPPKRGGSSDSRRVAVSEDEDGAREAQEAALRAIEQADEMDDDYGGSGRKATKKGKAAAKKRVRTGSKRGAEGDEVAGAASSNPKLRRPPTITKDDVPVKKDLPASSSVSPETTRSGRPSRNKPKRLGTSFVNESPIRRAAPAPPAPALHGILPPLPPMGDVSSISSAIPTADQPAPGRTASKKRSIVHDSEEEEVGGEERVEAGGPAKPAEGGASSANAGESALKNLQIGGEQDQPATTAGTARRDKPKQRKQIVQSSDAEDEGAVSDATSAIRTGDEFSDDDDGGVEKPTRGGKKGKEAARPARADSTASKSSTAQPTANKRPPLSTSPNRARGRSASTEERIEQMMKAAAGDEEQSLLKPASRSSTAKGVKKAAKGVTTDDEEEEEEEKARTSSSEAESKENEGSAIRKNGNENGTPVAARARSASGTPFSKAPRPGSLAAIMAKKGLATFRAPGLSARQRVPPLHTNLKPPPPAKKALPEKKVKKKKGDESYSDEEKPWYKRKDPEEWDDEDHRRWQKRLRRIDRGLPPDSDDD